MLSSHSQVQRLEKNLRQPWCFPFVFGPFSMNYSDKQWQGPGVLHHMSSHTDLLLLKVLLKARGYQQHLWGTCLLKHDVLGQARTRACSHFVFGCLLNTKAEWSSYLYRQTEWGRYLYKQCLYKPNRVFTTWLLHHVGCSLSWTCVSSMACDGLREKRVVLSLLK